MHNLRPSFENILGNYQTVDKWQSNLELFSMGDLGPANEESNALLRGILDSDDEKLASMCLGFVGNFKWKISYETSTVINKQVHNTLQNSQQVIPGNTLKVLTWVCCCFLLCGIPLRPEF